MRICSGCAHPFEKTHLLLNHRRSFRCGGEWNEVVYIPMHRYVKGEMVYRARPGVKYDPDKPSLPDHSLSNGNRAVRNTLKRYMKRRHKHRIPGTVRESRMEGGSGFRNNWEGAIAPREG